MRVIRNILAAVSFVLTAFFFVFFIYTLTQPDMRTGKIIGIIMFLVFIICGFLLRVPSKKSVEAKERMESLGILATVPLKHVEGLPLAENSHCMVSVAEDKVIIEGGGTDFNIGVSQIRAAEIKTDVEIANIVHSSAAKGIAGGLLFGPIGLVVGSRAMNKEKKTYSYYLVINYTNSAGELAVVMFESGTDPFVAKKITSKLKPLIINNPKQTVQL
ncbi:hypothetical protein BVG16_15675 [Paenibacillus selenitireducens]|uniref:Uncharacterized protein n=1 Tax=Paenibacillus selenitireducens TaxID=1324314 RepID=A0A1T2X9U6_9BACL|nr:hypothetical protein [Paenibacillus selenitireducens]OPA76620.1 hypothetical protein BVG16_15675 [Paenibacillus selenitireducens]